MNLESQRPERRVQLCLFVGIMLLFLFVWKGEGGYLDLHQYLDNTENMWLKGDISKPGQPGVYYIHPLGISFLSGPFVLAGAVIEKISGGLVGRRAVAAFSIPVFSALACLLLYKIGRELNLSPAVSFWGVTALALTTPFLNYTRFYYAEGGIALSLCLASWSFLRARRSSGRAAAGWMLLAGAGLAGATACHFNNLFVSLILWIAMSATFLGDRTLPAGVRAQRVAALSIIPVLAGSVLLYLNVRRFGGPFTTGYEMYMKSESPHPVSVLNVPENFALLGLWLMSVPWSIPAFCVLYKLRNREKIWAAGLAAATLAHLAFLQMFCGFPLFPLRYNESAVVLLSVGLLLIGNEIWKHWRERGLIYSWVMMLALSAGNFIRVSEPGNNRAFLKFGPGQPLHCNVWYMVPTPSRMVLGTPMGPLQWSVFAILLLSGSAVLALGFYTATKIAAAPVPGSTN